MDYPETFANLRKPAVEVSGRFPDFSIKKKFEKKEYNNKKFENLPKTCRKPPRLVTGGFQRFPDNPSLTDHTVSIFLPFLHN
jgi:hypothetical protein